MQTPSTLKTLLARINAQAKARINAASERLLAGIRKCRTVPLPKPSRAFQASRLRQHVTWWRRLNLTVLWKARVVRQRSTRLALRERSASKKSATVRKALQQAVQMNKNRRALDKIRSDPLLLAMSQMPELHVSAPAERVSAPDTANEEIAPPIRKTWDGEEFQAMFAGDLGEPRIPVYEF